jgi:anti-sigma regulatory factor (Ser/Thr protein kinase)
LEGLDDVRLQYQRGTSKRDITRLVDFASMKQLAPPIPLAKKSDDSDDQLSCFSSKWPRDRTTEHYRVEYQIKFEGCDRTVERLNTAIALIGISEDLDPRSTLQLRLCVYELTTNTVEHGTFPSSAPTICLGVLLENERVSVTYRDNAAVFLTTGHIGVDRIQEQIDSHSKRGLGLYLLNKLCPDFDYEWTGEWNISTFSFKISREHVTAIRR